MHLKVSYFLITSLVKEVMFSVVLVCVSVCLQATLLKMLLTDCNGILWRGPGWYEEQLIKFWW